MFRLSLPVMGLVLLCQSAQAGFTGSVSLSAGTVVTTGGHWATGSPVSLSWNINQNGNGSWNYSYTFTTPTAGGNLSHMLLEFSAGVQFSEILNFTGTTNGGALQTFSPSDPGNSNPNLPGPIFGLKINGNETGSVTFNFDIFRAPVWGDFYAKDGNAGGGVNSAWNSGFLAADPTDPASNGSLLGHILRPDSTSTVVPAPAAFVLLSSGALASLGGFVFRRRRQ